MAATAYSYVISLFAPSQLAAIAMTCIVQVVIAMLFFVGCFLTVDMANISVIYSQLEILVRTRRNLLRKTKANYLPSSTR
jgi:hypothetical protein